MSSGRFTGRIVVLTGAASGIGAATAERLAAEGAAVIVTDLDGDGAETVAARIRRGGGRARAAVCDVADPDAWVAVRDLAHAEFGLVDGVHVHPAVQIEGALDELSPQDWQAHLDVNLGAVYHAVRALLEDLRSRRGALVVTSSVHALVGMARYPAYAATKGALIALVRQLAVDLAPEVRVNAVAPGPVLTGPWERMTPQEVEASARLTTLGRVGRPEEVAAAVAFLLGDDGGFCTGTTLVVDGGFSVKKELS